MKFNLRQMKFEMLSFQTLVKLFRNANRNGYSSLMIHDTVANY